MERPTYDLNSTVVVIFVWLSDDTAASAVVLPFRKFHARHTLIQKKRPFHDIVLMHDDSGRASCPQTTKTTLEMAMHILK